MMAFILMDGILRDVDKDEMSVLIFFESAGDLWNFHAKESTEMLVLVSTSV